MSTGKKVGFGALSLLTAGLLPLGKLIAGGFKKTLQVYQSDGKRIDTGFTIAEFSRLKQTSAGSLAEGAKRKMALSVLDSAGATKGMKLLKEVKTNVLTDAARKLAAGDANPFEGLEAAHKDATHQTLDSETLSMVDKLRTDASAYAEKIKFDPPEPVDGGGRPVASKDERQVRNLFAEVVFPDNPADAHKPTAQRLREALSGNAEVAMKLFKNPDLIDSLGLPESAAKSFKSAVAQIPVPIRDLATPGDFQEALRKVPDSAFTKAESELDKAVDNFDFTSIPGAGDLAKLVGDDAVGGNFGKFMSRVFTEYFNKQDVADKRAMIGSFLRQTCNDDKPEMKLVGLLKGAGPYMQKILQLFGDRATGDLKEALGELKTGLSPIHPELKEAMFANIIEKSGGRIQSIDQIRSLGAASVGETLLARIPRHDSHGNPVMKDGKQEVDNVVVKLLRPGIQQRAARERQFFESVAKDIPGMSGTFAGIADQIDEEMDLTKEAANVRKAGVYNTKAMPNVRAMTLVEGVEPEPGFMLIERAPGGTVKKNIDVLSKIVEKGEAHKGKGGFHALEDGQNLAKALVDLSERWFEEAMYGSGFYHGDLHSGNMMFSPAGGPQGLLTAIDMGNATTLSPMQRRAVFKMVLATGRSLPGVFTREFERVLSPEGKAVMDQRSNGRTAREHFRSAVGGIMNARTFGEAERAIDQMMLKSGKLNEEQRQSLEGKSYDSPEQQKAIDPGAKILQTLGAANALGLEIPATISNFARSQQMLQTAIDQVNQLNTKAWEDTAVYREMAPGIVTGSIGVVSDMMVDGPAKMAFNQAGANNPPDYQKLRELASNADNFREPDDEGTKAFRQTFIDNCVLAKAEKPVELDFTDVIMKVAGQNKGRSFLLAYGDLFKLLKLARDVG